MGYRSLFCPGIGASSGGGVTPLGWPACSASMIPWKTGQIFGCTSRVFILGTALMGNVAGRPFPAPCVWPVTDLQLRARGDITPCLADGSPLEAAGPAQLEHRSSSDLLKHADANGCKQAHANRSKVPNPSRTRRMFCEQGSKP